jgi:hypothetical protein
MNIVGWRELFHFPSLSLVNIPGKIDTGAWGNVLHCDQIELNDNKLFVTIGNNNYIFDEFKLIDIKSSFGDEQERWSIVTPVILGNKEFKLRISLNNRDKMKYPLLIGRRFLQKFKYIVDVNKECININDYFKKV